MIYCYQFKRITSKEFLVAEPSKVIFDSSKRDKSPGLCRTRKLNFTVRIRDCKEKRPLSLLKRMIETFLVTRAMMAYGK